MNLPLDLSGNGSVSDTIIEKLFADLYLGTHIEDDISISNFNMYMREIFNHYETVNDFDNADEMEALCRKYVRDIELVTIEGTYKYGVRAEHWPHRPNPLYVIHEKKSLAFALALVQEMRYVSHNTLNSPGLKH